MGETIPGKDLTSLVDLAALELQKDSDLPSDENHLVLSEPQEKITEDEFGDLEQLSQNAAAEQPIGSQNEFQELAPDLSEPRSNDSYLNDSFPLQHESNDSSSPPEFQSQSLNEVNAESFSEPVYSEPVYNESPPQVDIISQENILAQPVINESNLEENADQLSAFKTPASEITQSKEPKQNLSEIKKLGERLAIGKPQIAGTPAFSVMLTSFGKRFSEKAIKEIENAITSEDYGIRIEDIAIQLTSGKLLIPQISEFAAIALAQKLRDVVETIELDLAGEIFQCESNKEDCDQKNILVDHDSLNSNHEETHDLSIEPKKESDLFSTNLPEIQGFQITRVLSSIMATEIVYADVAESPNGQEFEAATERLRLELISKAFKLRAHGVVGVNFILKSMNAFKENDAQKMRRAYRIMATGTAIRGIWL